MSVALIVTLIIGIAGPLATFVIAARKFSGKIKTTEASELWDEAGKLRKEYKDEIEILRGALRNCQDRLSVVEDKNRDLHSENKKLRHQLENHERTIGELHTKIESLEKLNQHLDASNIALRQRLTELEGARP